MVEDSNVMMSQIRIFKQTNCRLMRNIYSVKPKISAWVPEAKGR